MDISKTIEPRSDQLNAEDLLTGPRTVTITEVRRGNAEQPVDIVLAEYGPARPFKPSKTVRRILVAAWGADASRYAGRRMTLYRDPEVKFGGEAVGGIRVSALSDIPRPLSIALTVTRGKRAPHRIEPLPAVSPLEALRAEWRTAADLDRKRAIEAEVEALMEQQRRQRRADPSPAEHRADEVDEVHEDDLPEHDPTVEPGWPGEPLDGQK